MNDTKASTVGRDWWAPRALVALSIASFLLWSAVFVYRSSFIALDGQRYFSLFDDAMISMRYAWNLSHGNGLVWNAGERVEGYSNLLMVMVMAIPNLLLEKRLAALAVQILGVLVMLGNAWLVMRVARMVFSDEDAKTSQLMASLAFVGTLSYYPLTFWSLMGMETGLLTCLLLLGVLGYLRSATTKRTSWLAMTSLSLGLAFLTRPDSLVPSAVILAFTVTELFRLQGRSKQAIVRSGMILAGVGLLGLAQLIFRLLYYREVFPNTYILKLVGMPLGIRLSDGLGFVLPFMVSMSPLFALVAVGMLTRPTRWKLMFLSTAVAVLGYQVWVGGDAWPLWRMLAPAFPFLLMIALHGSSYLALGTRADAPRPILARALIAMMGLYLVSWPFTNRNPRLTGGIGPADVLLIALGASVAIVGLFWPRLSRLVTGPQGHRLLAPAFTGLVLMSSNLAFMAEIVFRVAPYTVEENVEMVNRAIAISQVTTSEATVGVFYAGAIPYYTGLRAIDFLGRADKHIARLAPDLSGATGWYGMRSVPGHNKYDLNYSIVELQPTYVQNVRWGRQDIADWFFLNYEVVVHRGVLLRLRQDDPNVLWDRLVPEE